MALGAFRSDYNSESCAPAMTCCPMTHSLQELGTYVKRSKYSSSNGSLFIKKWNNFLKTETWMYIHRVGCTSSLKSYPRAFMCNAAMWAYCGPHPKLLKRCMLGQIIFTFCTMHVTEAKTARNYIE
jgi:hypothetical protein